MEIEKLQAYGRLLRMVQKGLEEKGSELTVAEIGKYEANPAKELPILLHRCASLGILNDPKYDRQLCALMDKLDAEDIKEAELLPIEDRGVLQIAFWQYDTRWMTVSQAAEFVGVSRQAVDNAYRKNKIKGMEVGGHIRLFQNSVELYKKSREAEE